MRLPRRFAPRNDYFPGGGRVTRMGALEGIRVIDAALHYPGPFCSMMLADLGAEVLKIERPGTGDPARQWPPFFNSVNRNKRSLTLDLARAEGKDVFYELVKKYDVMTEGFRPGVARKLGIDFETLHRINPGLVYCSISGYGQDGPYRDLPGHDINYQALSGMLSCFRDDNGDPVFPALMIGDQSSGMFAAFSILAALLSRERTGQGQYLDCSMFDGLLFLLSTHLQYFFATGKKISAPDPAYGTFRTSDGKHLSLGVAYEDQFWDRICGALGLHDLKGLKAGQRSERQGELTERLKALFRTRARDEWVEALGKADVPASPLKEFDEVMRDPHVAARKMIQKISLPNGEKLRQVAFPTKLSTTPAQVRMPPPGLGEHTEEVLAELGYTEGEIKSLKGQNVV
jgi:crotonobetainyl-CoA:carnitine CoA-transferase CaiB-like acyl-CoA transferase